MTYALALDPLLLARWQFGITTVYHFIFVPLTIGMSVAVAIMQTLWYKSGKEHWLRATRFFGKIFLINFAIGVATGIVQEFQFGMNWSEYARMVGDIFGAPLAVEALLAFFLESTFLGLWIFGWGKISPKAHLACIWLAAAGVNFSAMWILGANAWMQHPVGAVFDPQAGRATLNGVYGFVEVALNPVMWMTIFHVVTGSWLLTGSLIAGLAIWWMVRAARSGKEGEAEARNIWRPLASFGIVIMMVGGVLTMASGHLQAQELAYVQPSKMAAAEALCKGGTNVPFTIATFSSDCKATPEGAGIGEVPGLLSFLVGNSFDTPVQGINDIDAAYAQRYGVETMSPPVLPSFWTFRLMIAFGMVSFLVGIWALLAMRGGKVPTSMGLAKLAIWNIPLPFIGMELGWIFTEIGRQPFLVYPRLTEPENSGLAKVYLTTVDGLSGAVNGFSVLLSLIIFTLIYLVLGIVWYKLLVRYAKEGIHVNEAKKRDSLSEDDPSTLSFAY